MTQDQQLEPMPKFYILPFQFVTSPIGWITYYLRELTLTDWIRRFKVIGRIMLP